MTDSDDQIDVRNPLENGWEENNRDYIPATGANAFAIIFLVEFMSCDCKKYCKKILCLPFEWARLHWHVWMRWVLSKHTLHYPESTWRESPTSRGTSLIFNSHADIFWKIAVLEKFTDLKMLKYLRWPKKYLQKSIISNTADIANERMNEFPKNVPTF